MTQTRSGDGTHRHLLRLTPARADAPEPDRGGRGRNEVQGWGVEAKSFPSESGPWKGSKSTRQPGSWSWHCHVGADGFGLGGLTLLSCRVGTIGPPGVLQGVGRRPRGVVLGKYWLTVL